MNRSASTPGRRLALKVALLVSLAAALRPGGASASSSPVPPKPDRYVTDLANVLPEPRAAALNEKLAAFERETSAQVLVYVAPKVPEGTTLEELGAAAIREWGVGQKGKSNGVVFFVFPGERKMRIATGYGLEGAIPDAATKRIQAEIVKPLFLKGDFAGGIEAGVDALLSAARGEGVKGTGRTAAEEGKGRSSVWSTVRWGIWGVFAAVFVLAWVRRSIVPGIVGILLGFVTVFVLVFGFEAKEVAGPAVALAFGSVAAIIMGAARQKPGETFGSRGRGTGGGDSSSSSYSSSSSSSDSSSSSSSSDFSGGGGDSGGGGSSESW